MTHQACWLRGGPAQWDPLVATFRGGLMVGFSRDSSQLATWVLEGIRFWDAQSGTPTSGFTADDFPTLGTKLALADDFSIVACDTREAIKLYSVATNMPIASFTPSESLLVERITLSHDGSLLAAALSNETVVLWDVQNNQSIATFNRSSGMFRYPPWHGLPRRHDRRWLSLRSPSPHRR